MKKGDSREMSTTTSSYETALTTVSRNRDKESTKEQASGRGSFPSSVLAPVTETVPEVLESSDSGINQSGKASASINCSPVVRMPSDQWLQRHLSQLGIPYVPRTVQNASAISAHKSSKAISEDLKGSNKRSPKPSQEPSDKPTAVISKETLKKPHGGRTKEPPRQSSREHSKGPSGGHSNEPTQDFAKTTFKELCEVPRRDISEGTSKEPSRKSLEAASTRSSQQASKESGKKSYDELFKRPCAGPSKAATTDFPRIPPESSTRPAAEPSRERTAAQTVTLTEGSESSDTRVGHPSSKETASEVSASASKLKERADKGIAPSKITEKDAAHSQATIRPLRGTEAVRSTNMLSGTTSPFTVNSAVSTGKPSFEDAATEAKNKERKVEPKTQPEFGAVDVGDKPKILAQPSFERRVFAPSHPQQSPPGRGNQQPRMKSGRMDRPSAKRSLVNRLFAFGLFVLLALAVALFSVAMLEHWWNHGRPTVKGLFGTVRGEKITVGDHVHEWTVHAFLGVPFAKAPRGPLRFKPPQQLDSPLAKGISGGTLGSLDKRPPCPQQDYFLGQQLVNTANGSEDCLHLNIWAPARNCSPDAEHGSCQGKTVLFFLYGASFQNGGNSFELYDGRYLSALGDLVVVVPNYRVGTMGFLSGPSPNTLSGNVGLHDQRLALSWTLSNIECFGGNASRLVLAGHDAGATSLGYHLFGGDSGFWTRKAARFILQSGGPFHRLLLFAVLCQYEGDGTEGAIRLATSLQCPADLVTEASLRCLQNASADAVARSKMAPRFVPILKRPPLSRPQSRQALETPASNILKTHDDEIIHALLRARAQTPGPQGKQFLLGRVQNEGAYPWFVEQQRTGSSDPQQLAARLIGHDNLDRWQNATGVVLDPTADDESYQEAVGDVLEACPMTQLAEQLHASKNRVYAYVLGYRPMYSSWTDETEAVHFDDMELVFGVPLRPGSPSSQLDKQWSRTMIHVWSTFARTGKPPTVKTSKWPAYDSHRLTTMKLGPRGVTAQRDPKWQRCRALRDSGAALSTSSSPSRATHGHYAQTREP
ncbi:uncharacterized protein LOC119404292 [Rhipicephalus sanguineus]|uniref:uncharacterized protein LOC119404292 n=1 Tax=Rhipicephalus sanguineus TaxID=34632 RepID=UPI0020C296A6|nr:uncharacterized protein LOC119404292 [Rhipicephalus sanguineus]